MKQIITSLAILLCANLFSQQVSEKIQIKTPQSYAFEKHGNVPISLYTGTLDLVIPIYSLQTGSEENVDISISYDSSGFLPHKKSDYAGMNWALLAGGRVTRTLMRMPDEYQGNPTTIGGNPFDSGVDLHGWLTGVRLNPYSNTQVYNLSSGAGGITGNDWRLGPAQNGYEGEPDIFNFSIMGLSGKFMIGNDGNVLVESDDPNIKVDLTGLVSYGGKQFCKPPNQTIKITDGEGNKYYFGGDFSKYEIGYNLSDPGFTKDNWFYGFPYISSFSISRVEFADGQVVTFNYVQDTLDSNFCHLTMNTANLLANAKVVNFEGYFQDGATTSEWQNCPGGLVGCSYSNGTTPSNKEYFVLMKKSMLESIKYADTEVKFNYKDIGYPIKHYEGAAVAEYFNEWLLDDVQVLQNNRLLQKTVFAYDDLGGINKRPFLKSITELQSNKSYSFEYYNTSNLPKYVTKGLDHWGYWNGNDFNTSLAPFDTYNAITGDYTLNNTYRDSNPEKYNVGLLSKIIYPTKGYTIFEYEPNSYGKRIERNSTSAFLPTLTNTSGVIGGARIKRQYDYSENGGIVNDTSYNYAPGILMNWPRYFYYFEFTSPGAIQKLMIRTSSNVQQNSLDSYNVGYPTVHVVKAGKGYTEYKFTSYEDFPDILAPDTGNIYNYFTSSTIAPENLYKNYRNLYGLDRSILRGRQKSIIEYGEDAPSLVRKTDYQYNDNMDFNPANNKDNYNFVSINHLTGAWVQGYKKYLNTSGIKKKSVMEFLNGSPIFFTTDYTYDSSKHLNLSKEKETLPSGEVNEKRYLYAEDMRYTNQPAAHIPPYQILPYMVVGNMTGIPLVTTSFKNNLFQNRKQLLHTLDGATNLVIPHKELFYGEDKMANPYPVPDTNYAITEVTYDKYDDKGNLLQYTTKNGIPVTLIWGYKKTEIIAKIEGAKLSDIPQNLIDTIVAEAEFDGVTGTEASDQQLISTLDNFRKNPLLSVFQITTYTYNPSIGVTSITTPPGLRDIYIYDTANRLKEIKKQYKDANGSLAYKKIEENTYNYKP